jgi:hypothetical protein
VTEEPKKKGRTALRRLNVNEISLVPEGSNPEAKVTIVKVAKMKPCADCKDHKACIAKGKCADSEDPKKVGKALTAAVLKLAPDIARVAAEQFGATPDLDGFLATLVTETIMDMEQLTAALETANNKIAELEATNLAKAKAAPDPALADEIAKAKATIEKQAKLLATLVDERDTATAVAKAKEIGIGDPSVVGPLLLRIEKSTSTAEDATALIQLLKTAAAQAQTNVTKLTTRVGRNAPDAAGTGFAAVAKARAEKDGINYNAAVERVMSEQPELYEQYLAENPSKSVG